LIDRLREKMTMESLEERVAKMTVQYEKRVVKEA